MIRTAFVCAVVSCAGSCAPRAVNSSSKRTNSDRLCTSVCALAVTKDKNAAIFRLLLSPSSMDAKTASSPDDCTIVPRSSGRAALPAHGMKPIGECTELLRRVFAGTDAAVKIGRLILRAQQCQLLRRKAEDGTRHRGDQLDITVRIVDQLQQLQKDLDFRRLQKIRSAPGLAGNAALLQGCLIDARTHAG